MIDLNKILDITITKKLTILFFAVTLGFVATASTYWFVIKNERESTKRSNLFIEYGALVSEAQKNYFKVRRFEKDFLLSISATTGQTYNEAPLDDHAKQLKSKNHETKTTFNVILNLKQTIQNSITCYEPSLFGIDRIKLTIISSTQISSNLLSPTIPTPSITVNLLFTFS